MFPPNKQIFKNPRKLAPTIKNDSTVWHTQDFFMIMSTVTCVHTCNQMPLFFLFSGETIQIVIVDYVKHLSNYNFDLIFNPELLFDEQFQYQNRIALEFNHLYHWHPLMPDEFNITGTIYTLKDFMFHPEIVVKHGLSDFVDSLSKQRAGMVNALYISTISLQSKLNLN